MLLKSPLNFEPALNLNFVYPRQPFALLTICGKAFVCITCHHHHMLNLPSYVLTHLCASAVLSTSCSKVTRLPMCAMKKTVSRQTTACTF